MSNHHAHPPVKSFSPPSSEHFNYRYFDLAGDSLVLITPKEIGVKWERDNLFYRSSIWHITKNGVWVPISLGFKKFHNWEEAPDLNPPPKSLKNVKIITKEDGSCLIVSRYKGQLITRTRGVPDATVHDNGYEIELLKQKYPKLFDNELLNDGHSIICEWVSPTNRIVLPYAEVDAILTGIVRHSDYSYLTQDQCDQYAVEFGVKRPKVYSFNTIDEMLTTVKDFRGVEGVCVYYNNDQCIRKVKGIHYLTLHRMKSAMNRFEAILDFYLLEGQPDYGDVFEKMSVGYDHEIAVMASAELSRIVDARKEVRDILSHMQTVVDEIKKLPTRKEQAMIVLQKYGKTERSGIVFTMLDGKIVDLDKIKKLYFQVLKK